MRASRACVAFLAACAVAYPASAGPSLKEYSPCEALLSVAKPNEYLEKQYAPRLGVFTALPTNATEYRAVYGTKQKFTASVKKRFANAEKVVAKATAAPFTERNAGGQSFQAFLDTAESRVVVVIGHNDRGVFRFSDGTNETVLDLHARCEKAGKFCIFITCNAGVLLKHQKPCSNLACKISAENAAHMLDRISQRIGKAAGTGEEIPMSAIYDAMAEEARGLGGDINARLVVGAAGVIGLVVVIYSLTEEDKKARSKAFRRELNDIIEELELRESKAGEKP